MTDTIQRNLDCLLASAPRLAMISSIMKARALSLSLLASLCLLFSASAVAGDFNLYDNGPINGGNEAWIINYGNVVSDTFTLSPSVINISGFAFGAWEFPGDTLSSVQWSLTTAANGGTVIASGTASGSSLIDKFLFTNVYGYNVDQISVTGLNVLSPKGGGTYWLNLFNATVPSGNLVGWDENSGVGCTGQGCPSLGFANNGIGPIPSEAFTITGIPEPDGLMVMFGGGFLALAGVSLRKLKVLHRST